MGVIKDILDAKSIEQKRKLVHRIVADKEDKDKLLKSGGGDNKNKIIYYKLKEYIESEYIYQVAANIKYLLNNTIARSACGIVQNVGWNELLAIAFMPQDYHGVFIESLEDLHDKNIHSIFKDKVERITAEQYYSNNIEPVEFKIAIPYGIYTGEETLESGQYIVKTYQVEPNMTFFDWLDSKYNVDKFEYRDDGPYVLVPYCNNNEYPVRFYGISGLNIKFNYTVMGAIGDKNYNTPNGSVKCEFEFMN